MRKYEGYFNAYEPFLNYRTKEEALFEQRCISLDLSEYADEMRCSKSLKQLLEDEHVVRVFDEYIDDIVKNILDNKKYASNDYYYMETDYVFKYDDSIQDNRKRAKVDLLSYHIINDKDKENDYYDFGIESGWHKITFGLIDNIHAVNAATYPRNVDDPTEFFMRKEPAKIWLNNDSIVITINFAWIINDISKESESEQIKNLLNHEFTHVLPRWAHSHRDVLCSKKNLMYYNNEFSFMRGKPGYFALERVKKIIHDVKNCELDAFYNQYIKKSESMNDDFFYNIFCRTEDEDIEVNLVIQDMKQYNHSGFIKSSLDYFESVNYSDKEDIMFILILSYYFRRYEYISCPTNYKTFLNIPYINGVSNDKVSVDEQYLKILYRKIKKVLYGAYKEYIDERLPESTKKFLKKKRRELGLS